MCGRAAQFGQLCAKEQQFFRASTTTRCSFTHKPGIVTSIVHIHRECLPSLVIIYNFLKIFSRSIYVPIR